MAGPIIVNGDLWVSGVAPFGDLRVDDQLNVYGPTLIDDDMIVSGNIFNGYERVSDNCVGFSSCSVSCSAGKKVTGGGCWAPGANLSQNYPSADNTWYCAVSSGPTGISAYALCARVQ